MDKTSSLIIGWFFTIMTLYWMPLGVYLLFIDVAKLVLVVIIACLYMDIYFPGSLSDKK
jgi:hypothetical protein